MIPPGRLHLLAQQLITYLLTGVDPFYTLLMIGDDSEAKQDYGCSQPSQYRLTIYRYAIIISFSKYR